MLQLSGLTSHQEWPFHREKRTVTARFGSSRQSFHEFQKMVARSGEEFAAVCLGLIVDKAQLVAYIGQEAT